VIVFKPIYITLVWALFRPAYPSKSRRMRLISCCLLCYRKMIVLAFMSRTHSDFASGIPLSRRRLYTAIIEVVRKWLRFLKWRHFTIVTDRAAISFMCAKGTVVKLKMLKFSHGIWNSVNCTMT